MSYVNLAVILLAFALWLVSYWKYTQFYKEATGVPTNSKVTDTKAFMGIIPGEFTEQKSLKDVKKFVSLEDKQSTGKKVKEFQVESINENETQFNNTKSIQS